MTTTEPIALHYQGYEFVYDPSADILLAAKHGILRQVGRGLHKALQSRAHLSGGLDGALEDMLGKPVWGESHNQHITQLCNCLFHDVLKAAEAVAEALELSGVE